MLIEATDAVATGAPWWFAGVTAMAGILVGILAKWLIDRAGEHHREEREDRLRFAENRLDAFAKFLTAVIAERGAYLRYKVALDQRPVDTTAVAARQTELEAANLRAVEYQQVLELLSPTASAAVRECLRVALDDDGTVLERAVEALRELARNELPARPDGM